VVVFGSAFLGIGGQVKYRGSASQTAARRLRGDADRLNCSLAIFLAERLVTGAVPVSLPLVSRLLGTDPGTDPFSPFSPNATKLYTQTTHVTIDRARSDF